VPKNFIVVCSTCRWLDRKHETADEVRAHFDRNKDGLYSQLKLEDIVELTEEMELARHLVHNKLSAWEATRQLEQLLELELDNSGDVIDQICAGLEDGPDYTDFEAMNRILEELKESASDE